MKLTDEQVRKNLPESDRAAFDGARVCKDAKILIDISGELLCQYYYQLADARMLLKRWTDDENLEKLFKDTEQYFEENK
jgi:hypothetical protein